MKLSVANNGKTDSEVVAIGYADCVAVYDSAEPGSDAWAVADEWLRYLQLRADGRRLMLRMHTK